MVKKLNINVVSIVCLVMVLALVGIHYRSIVFKMQNEIKGYAVEMDTIQVEHEKLNNLIENNTISYVTAGNSGKAVATFQSQFLEDGPYVENIAANLARHFSESEESGSVNWAEESNVPKGTKWEFLTPYKYTVANYSVCWACFDEDSGEVTAYAMADYDASLKKFSNLVYGVIKTT